MEQRILRIYSTCIPVKGVIRSIIYDLGRSDYLLIPNDLYDLLTFLQLEKMTLSNFKDKAFSIGIHEKLFEEYLNFLFEKEVVFEITEKLSKRIPDISFKWDFPSIASSITIVINDFSPAIVKKLVKRILTNTSCEHIVFLIKDAISYEILS